MKKLLVVLLASMFVLSMAVAAMAAATVTGDWRAEWIMQDSVAGGDLDFSKYDLRFNFDGKVSDTVDAHLQLAYDSSVTSSVAVTTPYDPDGVPASGDEEVLAGTGSSYLGLSIKEYWVNFKQSWGTVKAGFWDAKLFPSRILLKPHGVNATNNKAMQILFDVPVGDAFYAGLLLDPTLATDDMEYDLKFGYKADSLGAEVHYVNANPAKDDATFITFDVYYNVSDSIKVFLYGSQAGADTKKWVEELAPVIGATFKNVGGSKLTASLEYALEEAKVDYSQYALQLKYALNNKLAFEFEYTNEYVSAGEEESKLIIRPRVAF